VAVTQVEAATQAEAVETARNMIRKAALAVAITIGLSVAVPATFVLVGLRLYDKRRTGRKPKQKIPMPWQPPGKHHGLAIKQALQHEAQKGRADLPLHEN